MKNLVNKITAFIADEKGAEAVEWVLVAAALVGVITFVYGTNLQTGLGSAITRLTAKIAP